MGYKGVRKCIPVVSLRFFTFSVFLSSSNKTLFLLLLFGAESLLTSYKPRTACQKDKSQMVSTLHLLDQLRDSDGYLPVRRTLGMISQTEPLVQQSLKRYKYSSLGEFAMGRNREEGSIDLC
jgi:hypothetical protein